nr:MAG TPA: hypothetical protein [Caudoviricetes sp.]
MARPISEIDLTEVLHYAGAVDKYARIVVA